MVDNSGFAGILELKKAKGLAEKRRVLETYKDNDAFKQFLYYALSPAFSFGLKKDDFGKSPDEMVSLETCAAFFDNFFDLCDYLSKCREIDGATLNQVVGFVEFQKPQSVKNLMVGVLTGSLRLGVTEKTVNKIIPGLIPVEED